MSGSLSIVLLVILLVLAVVVRCDIRHAAGQRPEVPRIEPPDPATDPGLHPESASARKGGDHGPATQATLRPE